MRVLRSLENGKRGKAGRLVVTWHKVRVPGATATQNRGKSDQKMR